jgi:hypothetical protein
MLPFRMGRAACVVGISHSATIEGIGFQNVIVFNHTGTPAIKNIMICHGRFEMHKIYFKKKQFYH